ncbi:MAG: TonB-dependent receptor [Proteobacteria bacterium]|nr:TonB-dependent receptor [Pseudomonadota bacterium]
MLVKLKQPASIFSLLYLALQTAFATDYASDLDYYQDFPVVLSASRLRQPLAEAPSAMTVIDRKMIVASGFRSIPDLFKLVPGMYVSYYKGSSQAIVSYLGSTDQYSRRMQVMIDGRSVYLPPINTVDWGNLPITVDDIDRIEVIRGPAAASHGANSTQGVISIITRSPGGVDGKSLSVTQGSKGINDVSAHFDRHGETFDYRLTLAHVADNGYDDLSSPPNNIPITQFKAQELLNNSNDGHHADLLNYHADYHPNGADRFDIQFGYNHNVQGVGFSDKNPTLLAPKNTNGNTYHDLISNAGFIQLEWIRRLQDSSELRLQYYHSEQEQREAFPIFLSGALYANPPIAQSMQAERDNFEVQHTLHLGASNRLVYGAAYRVDRIRGHGSTPVLPPVYAALLPPTYAASFSPSEYRVFAHDEWRVAPQFLLNTGAMFERDGMGHQNTSPRVALNYHITPHHTLRTGASIAYRTPSLAESNPPLLQPGALYLPGAMALSPDLLPERLMSREIGYLGELREWATSLDLRLFSDQISNGIYVTNQKLFANGMSSEYQGFEATVKHSFGEGSDLVVNFAHELGSSNAPFMAAIGQKYFVPVSPWISDKLSGSIPRNSASVMYSRRLAHDFYFNAAFYYKGAMQPFDRGAIDYQPIQRRTDVRFAKTFRSGGGLTGELTLVLQNLFDKSYTEYIASNLFNRRGYATLSVKW